MRFGVMHPCPTGGRPHTFYLTLWKSKRYPWKWATLYFDRRRLPTRRVEWLKNNSSRGVTVRLGRWRFTLDLRLYPGAKPYYGRRRA